MPPPPLGDYSIILEHYFPASFKDRAPGCVNPSPRAERVLRNPWARICFREHLLKRDFSRRITTKGFHSDGGGVVGGGYRTGRSGSMGGNEHMAQQQTGNAQHFRYGLTSVPLPPSWKKSRFDASSSKLTLISWQRAATRRAGESRDAKLNKK